MRSADSSSGSMAIPACMAAAAARLNSRCGWQVTSLALRSAPSESSSASRLAAAMASARSWCPSTLSGLPSADTNASVSGGHAVGFDLPGSGDAAGQCAYCPPSTGSTTAKARTVPRSHRRFRRRRRVRRPAGEGGRGDRDRRRVPKDRDLVVGLGAHFVVARGDDVVARTLRIRAGGVDALIDAAVIGAAAVSSIRRGSQVAVVWRADASLLAAARSRNITVHAVFVNDYDERTLSSSGCANRSRPEA